MLGMTLGAGCAAVSGRKTGHRKQPSRVGGSGGGDGPGPSVEGTSERAGVHVSGRPSWAEAAA